MKIPILYEDKNILAINKPAGLLVHPSAASKKEPTLIDWILKNYPNIKGVGESMKMPDGAEIEKDGIVHRLDKDTSGVMLIAKNQKTFLFLKKQFAASSADLAERKKIDSAPSLGRYSSMQNDYGSGEEKKTNIKPIQKTYMAIVWGHVKNDKGKIDMPIGRSPSTGHFLSGRGVRGKMREALTEYRVIKRFNNEEGGNEKFTLLDVKPKTGRTHQIRVHMKFANYPIVCDPIYATKTVCPILGIDRLALHALSVEFYLTPAKKMKIEAPLPEDFKKAAGM